MHDGSTNLAYLRVGERESDRPYGPDQNEAIHYKVLKPEPHTYFVIN